MEYGVEKDINLHDLHIMLTKMDGKISLLLVKQNDNESWQEKHEETDLKRFRSIEDKISSLNKYAISLAVVAAFIGVMFDKIKNAIAG